MFGVVGAGFYLQYTLDAQIQRDLDADLFPQMSKSTPCRIIRGLVGADPCFRPTNIPKSRPKGRKAAGLKYERELAKGIPSGKHGQWFRFLDANGIGVCQPDILVKTSLGIAILESKYTWTQAGHIQLDKLYIPVVEKANPGVPAFGIVVCKVLTVDVDPSWICRDLASAIARASAGFKTVLHWVGAGLSPLKLT